MITKEDALQLIVKKIFDSTNPQIDESRKEQIYDFIKSAVNGDALESDLVINAKLSETSRGIIVYILTDVKLIKVEINQTEVSSKIFPLNTLLSIERKLLENDTEQFSVSFKSGAFGLKYDQKKQEITAFFQKIEQKKID